MQDHTLILHGGRWRIAGSTIDVGGNANIAIGILVVTKNDATWDLQEQINELSNRYDIEPLESGASTTTFSGENGALGRLSGAFVFFDDLILTTYRSEDGQYTGVEALHRIDADQYESRGALFLGGGHVSSWSMTLQRA